MDKSSPGLGRNGFCLPPLHPGHLSAAYDGHTALLHDVSFQVYRRDFLSIIGPSGGKTTLSSSASWDCSRPREKSSITNRFHDEYLPQYIDLTTLPHLGSGSDPVGRAQKSLISRFDDLNVQKAARSHPPWDSRGLEHRAIPNA